MKFEGEGLGFSKKHGIKDAAISERQASVVVFYHHSLGRWTPGAYDVVAETRCIQAEIWKPRWEQRWKSTIRRHPVIL